MEIHHCENPVCRFVTRHAVPDMCPLCGGAFFQPSDGSDLVAADWVALGIESKTDGRFDDAFLTLKKPPPRVTLPGSACWVWPTRPARA